MAKYKDKIAIQTAKYRKCSQEELANIVGVSQSNIGRYETGVAEPSLKTLIKIASVLQVSTDCLLGVETSKEEVAPEFSAEQLQVVNLVKKLNNKELEKVYNYLLGIIDARD